MSGVDVDDEVFTLQFTLILIYGSLGDGGCYLELVAVVFLQWSPIQIQILLSFV